MLIKELGINDDEPVNLYRDNQGSIVLVKNPSNHARLKHIDIKYHFIRDAYSKRIVEITYFPTNDNVADVITKVPSRLKLRNFHKMMFGDQAKQMNSGGTNLIQLKTFFIFLYFMIWLGFGFTVYEFRGSVE